MPASTAVRLPCLVCGHELQGLEPSQGCPECGLHVRRTLESIDAERILDSDEIAIRIPALQDVLDCLAEKNKALRSAELSEVAAAEHVITAAIQAADKPNIRTSLIRELYWRTDEIKVKWLQDAFGLNAHQVREIAGSVDTGRQCNGCGETLERKSRSGCVGYLCSKCDAADQEARNADWKARDVLKMQRVRELQTIPYAEYLITPEWQERRKQHLRSAGYKCQVCNAGNVILNVHHRTYERRGCEYFKDLIVLCELCHGIFHREGKLAEWER